MGNTMTLCTGGRNRRNSAYSFEVPMDIGSTQRQHRKLPTSASGDAESSIEDGYEARMQIDNEELAARYRHCMQTTDKSRRRSSSSVRRRPGSSGGGNRGRVVTFRAESFDSQVSTESERRNFVMLLIDSLPETFLDDDVKQLTDSTTLRVSAQVNHYDVDEEDVEDEAFASASYLTPPPCSNAMLSESTQSTYESIKSMEEAAGDGPSSSAPSSPPSPPPPPPPPKNQPPSKSKQSRRQAASAGKIQHANGIKETELTAS